MPTTCAPLIESDPASIRRKVLEATASGRRVGFVPTMGALHAGHLSLVKAAADCDDVVVSIFVNPTQFAPGEDFERYPRSLEADCSMLADAGVRWVFAPPVEAIYPAGDATRITVDGPSRRWEGEHRPGHFQGVTTVVGKLFMMVPAAAAYFGAKDWQQTVVIQRMVRDLAMPIDVVVCPTVRETDGLAMSSRNVYLNGQERLRAVALSAGLTAARACWQKGGTVATASAALLEPLVRESFKLDYAAIVDPTTLEPWPDHACGVPAIALAAGRVGSTRLIDNMLLS
jgi:pantoate--beta-alanine ligase